MAERSNDPEGTVRERNGAPSGAGSPFIEFLDCDFAYNGNVALQDITFAVEPGEFAAVLGPNGSGKSTLLKLALGLLRPAQGSVTLFGHPAHRFRDWSRVGYVPQLVEDIRTRFPATAEEVVEQGHHRGFSPGEVFRRRTHPEVVEAMETAGVGHLRRSRISELSTGQQQRVLIARALVRHPELLVLDEPVAGVDAGGQEQFFSLLRRLNDEMGLTILMVSHDIGAVIREATTVACIDKTLSFHGAAHDLSTRELSDLYGISVDLLIHDRIHEHR